MVTGFHPLAAPLAERPATYLLADLYQQGIHQNQCEPPEKQDCHFGQSSGRNCFYKWFAGD